MGKFILTPHPDRPPSEAGKVWVDVVRGATGYLRLEYGVRNMTLRLPAVDQPTRTDGLWRTTCFELFLMFDDREHYVEFNFSPSTQWAAYAFEGYREGMVDLALAVPGIERTPEGLSVDCDISGLPHGELAMGLAAVIEESDGTTSYWALAHPPGAPDFHAAACFAATLPPPAGA